MKKKKFGLTVMACNRKRSVLALLKWLEIEEVGLGLTLE
jgi:hypothetical protein